MFQNGHLSTFNCVEVTRQATDNNEKSIEAAKTVCDFCRNSVSDADEYIYYVFIFLIHIYL